LIIFLKLGGSLITDKNTPHTPRLEIIRRLGKEIVSARQSNPDLNLVLGHGSGSFGHVPAKIYHTYEGVHSPDQWQGFVEVWRQARDLNQIMLDELTHCGLPVMAFPPSAFILAKDRAPEVLEAAPLSAALQAGLIPLVAGDVIFDTLQGGTIFSTEEVFLSLAEKIHPQRVLICGIEEGVWADYPDNSRLVETISPDDFESLEGKTRESASIDVTGGMRSKVDVLVRMVKKLPRGEAVIFSGAKPGSLFHVLTGGRQGTVIANSKEVVE
jgi:isopentenyl phosphate kinase